MNTVKSSISFSEIRIPREIVNDDIVTIQKWLVSNGDYVSNKQTIALVETSKTIIEIQSEEDGFLEIEAQGGSKVSVGSLIAKIFFEKSFISGKILEEKNIERYLDSNSVKLTDTDPKKHVAVSAKALLLMKKHEIDISILLNKSTGMIREIDIVNYLAETETSELQKLDDIGVNPSDAIKAPLTKAPNPLVNSVGLSGEAIQSAKERGRGVPWLILNYLWRNWFLGNLVRWAPRGLINILHRWRGVKMGRDCFIDPTAILETAYPENITLGNDVRVTVNCIIMTHIKAPLFLRNSGIMPSVISPVKINDHAFIGVNSVVMPGVTIGFASVIASGSVVVSDVPPYTMVAGNPAKVIKRFPHPNKDNCE